MFFSVALCFIGVATCVDTELNESGNLRFDFIDRFCFV